MSIKLGLLRLAEFLLCELGRKQKGRPRGQAFGGWSITPHPGAWLLLSRMRRLGESEPWLLEAPESPSPSLHRSMYAPNEYKP